MPNVTAGPGDCFNRIAKSNGFFNYLSVYNHGANAASFPNPNHVERGAVVDVPDKHMTAYTLPLDADKLFLIDRKKAKLKIKICAALLNKTPAMSKATLVVNLQKAAGTTGTLEIDDVDPDITMGSLMVTLAPPAAFAGPPPTSPAATEDQNPPALVADDFDDPATVWPKKGEVIGWDLRIGHLEPHTTTRGVLQRLQNLGLTCPIQQFQDAKTQRAVKTYRRFREGKVAPADTDDVADIQAHIKGGHDD